MKKHLNIFLMLLMALTLGSCSKDDPFPGGGFDGATGTIKKSSLQVELQNEDGFGQTYNRPALTRAAAPSVDDFTVNFYNEDGESVAEYRFGDMPEVVTLPAGAIKAVATYGENAAQDWEAPHYKGETQFVVVADRVTEDIDPIVASLANVRVSIVFAPGLRNAMSADSKVTVVVGENGTLDFTPEDEGRSGYFAYVENSKTLTATFRGVVDGGMTVESKGYDNVAPGNHYRITFKMHDAGDQGDGSANGDLTVDATVEVVDMNISVTDEDEILVDDMRPTEGADEPEPGPAPGEEDNPKPYAVSIASSDPDHPEYAGYDLIDLNNVNEINDHLSCAWKVISEAEGGFTAFTVDINSETLDATELSNVGLSDHLDLVNPGEFKEALAGLGFAVEIGGEKEASFDITGFLSLLQILGPASHEFVMTVSDANGTSVIRLKLVTK